VNSHSGPAATLGSTAAAGVRIIVRCKACRHQVEPDAADVAARYGADMSVLDWKERLTCSECGSRDIDMVLTGALRGSWEGGGDRQPECRGIRARTHQASDRPGGRADFG